MTTIRRVVLTMVGTGIAVAAAACGSGDPGFPIAVTDDAVASGRQVYGDNCASCHGFPGETPRLQAAPRHDSQGHTWHHADRQLYEWILDRPPLATVMPAFRGVLTEQQVREVIAYIKSEWPEDIRSRQERFSREYEQQLEEFGP